MPAVFVAALFSLVTAPALAADRPVPKYKGKPLAYWVERLQKAPTDAEQFEAAEAVIAFGPDAAPAVPELLTLLDDRSKTYRGMIVDTLYRLGPAAKDAVPALTKRLQEKKGNSEDLIRILCAIGSEGKVAIPSLIPSVLEIVARDEKVPDSEDRLARRLQLYPPAPALAFGYCIGDLHRLGAEAVPVLLAMIDAPGTCGKEYAAMAFCELGPKGVKGVPALTKLLKHEKPEVRYIACLALWKVAKSPDVVPALIKLVEERGNASGHGMVPAYAAAGLGEMGAAAKDALPALRALALYCPVIKDAGNTARPLIDGRFQAAAEQAIAKIEGKPQNTNDLLKY